MAFITVAAGAPSVFVSSSSELAQAYATLSASNGGGTIYLSGDFETDGEIRLSGGGDNPVHITSGDPADPVDVSRIYLDDVNNLKVSGIEVDSTNISVPTYQGDVDINNSSSIELSNITFQSDGSEFIGSDYPDSVDGGRLAMITESSDITITDTVASQYFLGWSFIETSGIHFEDNEIFAMQGDGIKMREVQDVLIKDNYLHDFAVTSNDEFHSDFIQLHSSNADASSSDVTITGNILETGNGSSVQAIWIGSATAFPHQDITITDNLIYTGSANGIGVNDANGVLIDGNTLLWNPEAETVKAGGNTSYEPAIRVNDNVSDLTITDNITPKLILNSDANTSGNVVISYNSSDPNYVGDHFVNVVDGGDIGPDDWQLLESSPWVGLGASTSQPGGADPQPDPQPEPEPEPQPDPQPDPQPEPEPEPQPEPEPDPQPEPPAADATTLFAADFEDGVSDLSGYDSTFRTASEANIVGTPDGSGYEIGSGKMVRLNVDNDQIHSLDSFGFEMEITLLGSDDVGRFVHFPRAFEASVERDGTVTFELTTDQGTFEVNSGQTVLNDGESHTFAVGYDDAVGKLSMSIDGTVVGVADASGTTGAGVHHGLTIGSAWGNSVDAIVDDIFLGTDPMEAGVDLSLDVGESFYPPIEPPVGGPIDPPVEEPVDPPVEEPVDPPVEEPVDPPAADLFTSLFEIDFENGISDGSDYASDFKNGDSDSIVQSGGDNSYQIGNGDFLRLERGNEQIHELDGFGLRLDIQMLEADDTGRFIHFPRAFEGYIEDDRSISFRLTTDEGTFSVNSGETNFDDLQSHSFAIGFDGDAGRLTMAIDGDVVDSVAASGQTGEMSHHGLTIGSIWGDDVMALVDNVWLGEPVEGADVSADAGLIHSLNSIAIEPDPEAAAPEADLEEDLDVAV